MLFICACGSNVEPEISDQTEVPVQNSAEIIDVVEYHPNGAVKLRGKSQDGKRLGKWESFYPSGYRWSEVEYRSGLREGDAISYYDNGMMRYQGRYYNDEQTGVWSFYDTTGALVKRIDMDTLQSSRLSSTPQTD